jgi:hypothetical protein
MSPQFDIGSTIYYTFNIEENTNPLTIYHIQFDIQFSISGKGASLEGRIINFG